MAWVQWGLGDLDFSIAPAIQMRAGKMVTSTEVVLMTHEARGESMQRAIRLLDALDMATQAGNVVRVEELI